MEENKLTELKEAVNQFLWQRLPEKATLKEAEDIAVMIYYKLVESYERHEKPNVINPGSCL